LLDLLDHMLAATAQQGPQAAIEAELLAVVADEVEHRAQALAVAAPQPTPELLEEQGRAVGGPEQEQAVHAGDVDALVEQVDGEDHLDFSAGQLGEGLAALLTGGIGPDRARDHAQLVEHPGHEARVAHAHAEAERAQPRSRGPRSQLLEHEAGAHVVAGVDLLQRLDVVAAAAFPGHLTEVHPVVDAEVGERGEAVLVDRVPQAQLGGDPLVEPVEDRQAVAALGRGGQAEQLTWAHVIEERRVAGRGGVVELVHDHHVEVVGRKLRQARRAQALDGGKDVLEVLGTTAGHPQLAEGVVAERVAEGGQALGEQLLAMGHEQQASPAELARQPRVVDRGHDRLAGAGRRDQEVLVVTLLARHRDLLEQALLERLEAELDGAQHDLRRGVVARHLRQEDLAVVGLEVAAVPVGLEDTFDLADHVGIPQPGDPHVPLQAVDLRRVGQVRRADVRGRGAGAALEQPGLGV
jgi:hypothetical protein